MGVWNRLNRDHKGETLEAYALLGPMVVISVVFWLLPVGYAIALAFHRVQLLGEVSYRFVGLKNFWRMAQDERMAIALGNTLRYAAVVVPVQTLLGLGLALVLNSSIRGRAALRVLYFLPTVTSSAVLTLIFMSIYHADGLLNQALRWLHLPTANWLADPKVALSSIMAMNIWSTAPLFMVIYLAALQDIPRSLYEAADLDGASGWDRVWYITLPALKPVTFFVVMMGIIGTFQLFDQSYIFSAGSGGPNNATLTVVLLIYQYAFKSLDMGYAMALTLGLAVILMLATLLQRRIFQADADPH